jgi:hypothetical protein
LNELRRVVGEATLNEFVGRSLVQRAVCVLSPDKWDQCHRVSVHSSLQHSWSAPRGWDHTRVTRQSKASLNLKRNILQREPSCKTINQATTSNTMPLNTKIIRAH